MKRFHVNMTVKDISEAVRFYSALFDAKPAILKNDYAKWMLEDPRINFAISVRGAQVGVNHLGMQVESTEELEGMRAQLARADKALVAQTEAACCYATSDKYWITDPVGMAWETFHTLSTIPIYGTNHEVASQSSACCVPANAVTQSCCTPATKAASTCCS